MVFGKFKSKEVASPEFMKALRQFLKKPEGELLPEILVEFMGSNFLLLVEGQEQSAAASLAGDMLQLVNVVDENDRALFAAFTSEEQMKAFSKEEGGQTLTLSGPEIYDMIWGNHEAIVINPGGSEEMVIETDWLMQVCGPRNPHLVMTLSDLKDEDTAENRKAMLEAFATSIPLVAMDEPPEDLDVNDESKVLESLQLAVRHTINDAGEKYLLVFSDMDELLARMPDASWMAVSPLICLNWASQCVGIVINPAGDWVEIKNEELKTIEDKIPEPPHEHGENCNH